MFVERGLAEAEEIRAEERGKDRTQSREKIGREKRRTSRPRFVAGVIIDRAHLAVQIAARGNFEKRLDRTGARDFIAGFVGKSCRGDVRPALFVHAAFTRSEQLLSRTTRDGLKPVPHLDSLSSFPRRPRVGTSVTSACATRGKVGLLPRCESSLRR